MRRCLPGDLFSAAACLAAADQACWAALATRLLAESDAAHRYAKRFGRAHPLWGNGSLMARAKLLTDRPADPQSARFLAALALIAARLSDQKTARSASSCGRALGDVT